MNTYPISSNEQERLQELFNYQILDTPAEKEFEELVQIALNFFNVPAAAITFIEASRQWVKAESGLNFCELNRGISICNYTILQNSVLEIADLQGDERFADFPYVAHAPFYRFYAGVPLITSNGYKIGVFCIVDTVVRTLSEAERQMLVMLAKQSMKQVELSLRNKQLESINIKQRQISSRLSHDIRNPLSNIKMLLDMQSSSDEVLPQEENIRLSGMLAQQVGNTIGMLDNMIQWGKLHLEGAATKTRPVNLRKLAGEVINEIAMNSSIKQNILINAIAAEVNAEVDMEGVRFTLRNLLTNANKFTAQGCITVSYECTGDKGYIHVADTGVGMSKEQTAKLNMNGQTEFAYGTHNEKGNGLGLGLLYDYLAQNEGRLHFQSEEGRGTKASFSL